jgi:galactokinase
MNTKELKNKLLNGGLYGTLYTLYGNSDTARDRIVSALDEYHRCFGGGDVRLFSAPGRTEVGGNHTDHQHGCVLAGSINLDVLAVVGLNNDGVIRIQSKGYPMDEINVSDLAKKLNEKGRSAGIIRGICYKFAEMGCQLGGFNAYTTSNVLKGSGLSSSAAFEVLVCNIINTLYFEKKASPIEIAKIGQFAEREFFSKPCGLLDQMASSLGGFTYADFGDPQNPVTESIELDIQKFGHTLCVVDTGGNHANLTKDYAAITLDCKAISNALGVEFLREADPKRFYNEMASLRKTCGDRAVLRGLHFFNEQVRVEEQRKALKDGDFDTFLKLVDESGESSYKYLQNLYSITNVKEQGLSLGIALTKQFLKGKGACRVHGGGFAGTIQCYIPNNMLADYVEEIEKVFGKGSCNVLNIRPFGGCEIIF